MKRAIVAAPRMRTSLTIAEYNLISQKKQEEEIIYRDKKITPEQTALLDGPDSPSLPPAQGLSELSTGSAKKSRGTL